MLYSAIRPLTTTFVSEPQHPQSACLQTHPYLPQVRPLQTQRIRPAPSTYHGSAFIPLSCLLAQSSAPAFALASTQPPRHASCPRPLHEVTLA